MLRTEMTGKVAVVTAGAGVIGEVICKTFAASGAAVAVCDKDLAAAEKVAGIIAAAGGNAKAYALDIRNKDSFSGVVSAIASDLGGIDILINNENEEIDPNDRKPLHEFDMDMYDDIVNAGINGVYYFSKACTQEMEKRGKGAIVNVLSIRGVIPVANQSPVVAVAAAQVGYTRMWGVEMKDYNIRVNAVAAGLSRNEKNADTLTNPEAKLSHVAVRRLCEPADVANAALFLASDGAAYITGAVLPVDGGLAAGYVRSF